MTTTRKPHYSIVIYVTRRMLRHGYTAYGGAGGGAAEKDIKDINHAGSRSGSGMWNPN
jgi:hypothetical protein